MQRYARMAKVTELIDHATEIRLRAERRAGEMPKAKGGGDTSTGSRVRPVRETDTLADLSVTKTQWPSSEQLESWQSRQGETGGRNIGLSKNPMFQLSPIRGSTRILALANARGS